MRLYSFISNERGIKKQQGGNNYIKIEFLAETETGSWETSTEHCEIYLRWLDGKPKLSVYPSKNWEIQTADDGSFHSWRHGDRTAYNK